MNFPRYIQPVVEGDTRGALSESIYKPIVALARAIQNIQGRNCEVYESDGRLVVDLLNSTRGPNAANNRDDLAPDDRVGIRPPYTPPVGGWDGGAEARPPGAPAVATWSASKYARHDKRGFYPFTDYHYFTEPYTIPTQTQKIQYTQNVSGTHYLTLRITNSGAYFKWRQVWSDPADSEFWLEVEDYDFGGDGLSNIPGIDPFIAPLDGGNPRFVIDPLIAGAPPGAGGPPFGDITRAGYPYWLQNPASPTRIAFHPVNVIGPYWMSETPQSGELEITLNQYSTPSSINNLYFYNSGSFDVGNRNNWIPHLKGQLVVDQELNTSQTTYNWLGCTVTLENKYSTQMLHTDVYNMLMSTGFTASTALNFEFVQPSGATSGTTTGSLSEATTIQNGPGTGVPIEFYDNFPVFEAEYTTQNQNVITTSVTTEPAWNSYGTNVFYGAMHFRRKANGREGTYEYPTGFVTKLERRKVMVGNYSTIYVATYSVPTEHIAPRYPQIQMPASAELIGVEAINIGVGEEVTLSIGDSPGYSVWAASNLAALSVPPTPAVYTGGGTLPPTLSKSGLNVTYTFYNGEPYLRWKIYRNTVNNSGTATEIIDTANICDFEFKLDVSSGDIELGIFRMVYVDTVPSAGTYYYWHKAYWDISRISGFSAVTSITV